MIRYIFFAFLIIPILSTAQVNYYKDIAPIIKANCLSCHRSGNIGPMPLSTYEEVASYASMIKYVTDSGLMPPFIANHQKVTYANERSISDSDKKLIAKWIEEGLTEGIPDKRRKDNNKETDKAYDYTICMLESFEHYGIYYDQYQTFVLPIELGESKFIKEIVFEPGNKEIVRSANFSIATKGSAIKMDDWDPRYGFFAFGGLGFNAALPNWYNWMPNTPSVNYDNDERLYLPDQSEILMHIHYGPFGEIQKDSSCLHFIFDKMAGPTLQNVPFIHTDLLSDTFLIESGDKKRISDSFVIPVDAKLRSITPLAHLLCRTWEVFAVLPDKSSVALLSIDDWDFHWREKYVFEEIINLPAGTKIYSSTLYDNTLENPYNPADPPHTMDKGPHMYDENFECYFEFVPPNTKLGYIIKPFNVLDKDFKEVSFILEHKGNITIQVDNLSDASHEIISSKYYERGLHTLQSSKLPSKKGRYAITISGIEGIIDTWWFVIL